MEPEQSARLEHILGHMAVGVAILDCYDLRFLYANPYLLSLLDEPWHSQSVVGHALHEVIPGEVRAAAEPILRQVCASGQRVSFSELPYEGFLETRGRTYWRVAVELSPGSPDLPSAALPEHTAGGAAKQSGQALLITIEDVTSQVRSRMHIEAIHHISSAIAGRFALPQVLDRILQAVQELVGSTRCAILLIDYSVSGAGLRSALDPSPAATSTPTVTIAAQKGLHFSSQYWHPVVGKHLLLGRVLRERQALVIPDTSTIPEIELPMLDDNGRPRRPGSVVCVPIFEPSPSSSPAERSASEARKGLPAQKRAILGTIEVYHRRARGLPAEEVELLEQFAQQAGLAIQNARLFLRIDRLARDARKHVRQRENVMQAIPDGVIIYDSRWRVADTNSAIRKLLGWSEDVTGLHISEALARSTAIFPEGTPSINDLVAELERSPHEKRVDEFKMIGADRRHYTIRRSKAPIQDELGNIFAFVVVYHDITEQATAREQIEAEVIARTRELAQRNQALLEAQAAQALESARLELLLARLPSAVLLVSANDQRIIVSNRQAARLLQRMGWKQANGASTLFDDLDAASERAIGANIEEILRSIIVYGPAGAPIRYEEQPLYLALHKGEASEAELHITQPDGQTLYLLVNAAPLRASDGTITDAVVVLQDITKIKALERAREDFFTTMAHELKTPLANIRAHLSALQARDLQWSTEDQLEFLRTADEQVERLVGMINQFLDASRVEAGALRLDLEPILLPELFEDLQERLEALIASSNRTLEINVPPTLPAVLADYELIISVLTNLLSNAFRYAPEGDVVHLEAEVVFDTYIDQPSGVEIRVTDRGVGITPERQAELFTRFSTFAAQRRPALDRPGQPVAQKQRSSTHWSSTSGLGLYISRGIIEAHGSQLKLKSIPGEGTTFAFTLNAATLASKEG